MLWHLFHYDQVLHSTLAIQRNSLQIREESRRTQGCKVNWLATPCGTAYITILRSNLIAVAIYFHLFYSVEVQECNVSDYSLSFLMYKVLEQLGQRKSKFT